jgi:hypothetical protein
MRDSPEYFEVQVFSCSASYSHDLGLLATPMLQVLTAVGECAHRKRVHWGEAGLGSVHAAGPGNGCARPETHGTDLVSRLTCCPRTVVKKMGGGTLTCRSCNPFCEWVAVEGYELAHIASDTPSGAKVSGGRTGPKRYRDVGWQAGQGAAPWRGARGPCAERERELRRLDRRGCAVLHGRLAQRDQLRRAQVQRVLQAPARMPTTEARIVTARWHWTRCRHGMHMRASMTSRGSAAAAMMACPACDTTALCCAIMAVGLCFCTGAVHNAALVTLVTELL